MRCAIVRCPMPAFVAVLSVSVWVAAPPVASAQASLQPLPPCPAPQVDESGWVAVRRSVPGLRFSLRLSPTFASTLTFLEADGGGGEWRDGDRALHWLAGRPPTSMTSMEDSEDREDCRYDVAGWRVDVSSIRFRDSYRVRAHFRLRNDSLTPVLNLYAGGRDVAWLTEALAVFRSVRLDTSLTNSDTVRANRSRTSAVPVPVTIRVLEGLSATEGATWPAFALDTQGAELRVRTTAMFACGTPDADATRRNELVRVRIRPAPGSQPAVCASKAARTPVEVRVPLPPGDYHVEVAVMRAAFELESGRASIRR